MKISYKTLDGKIYNYTESIWTGKKTLSVDGVPMEKFNKNEFKIGEEVFAVKGSFLSGVKLVSRTNPENTIVLAKNKWYEWILIFLPFVFWAVTLVPVIGGWIWSLLGMVVASPTNARILRSEMNTVYKIISCIAVLALLVAFWLGMQILIIELFDIPV